MDNVTYFNNIKSSFDSLSNFELKDNILFFQDTILYKLPLNNVILSNLNPNLFMLKARDIYRVIYMLELLPSKDINENDKTFITQYVEKYLDLETKKLANEEVDDNEVNCLGIPIYLSDDPRYENTLTSNVIHNLINANLEKTESGKGNYPVLVRTNPNYVSNDENTNIEDFAKAGFATMILIGTAILGTCLYITLYLFGK